MHIAIKLRSTPALSPEKFADCAKADAAHRPIDATVIADLINCFMKIPEKFCVP